MRVHGKACTCSTMHGSAVIRYSILSSLFYLPILFDFCSLSGSCSVALVHPWQIVLNVRQFR